MIAILHPHGGMGDLLLSYPVIQAFADAFPQGKILYVTPPGLEAVIRVHPAVAEVVPLLPGFSPALQLARRLREKKTKIACALWSTARIAWLVKFAGIPVRIGQGNRLLSSFLFTHPVPVRSASGDLESHWVDCLLDYPRAIGLVPSNQEIHVPVPSEALGRAKALLSDIGAPSESPFLIFHCGKGENVLRRGWPVELFASAADSLAEKGFSIVFTGSAREIFLVESVQSKMKRQSFSTAGKTDFLSLAALLQLSSLLVCPDSGPMHLAAAVRTPVVAIFAMKKDFPQRWKPWKVKQAILRPTEFPCRSWCAKENCPDFQCYRRISPQEIVDAVLSLVSR